MQDQAWEPRRAPRIVIDTPTVVSALMFGGGEPGLLRQAWQARRCLPMVCESTERKLVEQLDNPSFGFSRYEQLQLFHDYIRYAFRVKIDGHTPIDGPELPGLSSVRLALAGRAHALITADPDLLMLAGRLRCPVMSLGTFLKQLETSMQQRRRPSEAETVPARISAAVPL
jgi:uncharacterized protein